MHKYLAIEKRVRLAINFVSRTNRRFMLCVCVSFFSSLITLWKEPDTSATGSATCILFVHIYSRRTGEQRKLPHVGIILISYKKRNASRPIRAIDFMIIQYGDLHIYIVFQAAGSVNKIVFLNKRSKRGHFLHKKYPDSSGLKIKTVSPIVFLYMAKNSQSSV